MHETFESIAALDAIGVASAEEARDLRVHLAECVPCRRARDEYAEALTQLIEPVAPPREVRARVIEAVMEAVFPAPRGVSPWWLATAATLFLALWGWRELAVRASRDHAASQQAEIKRLEEENTRLSQRSEKLSAEIAALAGADTRTIALSGQEVAPSANAKVFLEPSRRRALVFFHNLPANPDDKSYQLWIIRSDQPQPMSAGVFDVTETGSASIVIENLPLDTMIKALAVTLEPKGGVAQPTNTRFYVAGNT
jgi:anti-sigma-K factor RskA